MGNEANRRKEKWAVICDSACSGSLICSNPCEHVPVTQQHGQSGRKMDLRERRL